MNRRKEIAYAITKVLAGTGCAALLPHVVMAEQTDAPAALEEITVSAQRREQSLQDVPIAIQVVDRALIADVAAENMASTRRAPARRCWPSTTSTYTRTRDARTVEANRQRARLFWLQGLLAEAQRARDQIRDVTRQGRCDPRPEPANPGAVHPHAW